LRPALSYVDGHTPILQGKYLFIEYFVVNDGTSSASECPGAAMIDFPGYSFSQGILNTGPVSLADLTPALVFLGFGQAAPGNGRRRIQQSEIISGPFLPMPSDHPASASEEIVAEILQLSAARNRVRVRVGSNRCRRRPQPGSQTTAADETRRQ
jgi:hypothetical protein